MARPSTRLIRDYGVTDQFKQCNIKAIINAQVPLEHANCGDSLEAESGFSYLPQTFMDSGIYFFNFGLPDFGVASVMRILDVVKVMAFALREGKVAIHCHAGLGRTGVIIACYLVYATRITPEEAICFVRLQRPGSIQTLAQINLITDFAKFLNSLRLVYANVAPATGSRFTLSQYLARQKHLLHGNEGRALRNIPKVVGVICKRLVQLMMRRKSCITAWAELEKESKSQALTKAIQSVLFGKGRTSNGPLLQDPDNLLHPLQNPQDKDCRVPQSVSNKRLLNNQRSFSESNLHKESSKATDPGNGLQDLSDRFVSAPLSVEATAGAIRAADPPSSGTLEKVCTAVNLEAKDVKVQEPKNIPNGITHTENFLNGKDLRDRTQAHIAAIALALAEQESLDPSQAKKVQELKSLLNKEEAAWARLSAESSPRILSAMLWCWLEHLKEPLLSVADTLLLLSEPTGWQVLSSLHKCKAETIFCILECISKMTGLTAGMEDAIYLRFARACTQCPEKEARTFSGLFCCFRLVVADMRELGFSARGKTQIRATALRPVTITNTNKS